MTYTADYTISTDASYSGSIVNTVTVQANGQGGSGIVTDQGDDPSTGAANDATVVDIDPFAALDVTKTTTITDEGDGIIGAGDVINYTNTLKESQK